ncbi:hypothetical protein [Pseudomonas huaxiensis]|uniref:hypothetical protein n=1 Tax=Pseudomonas huaxiensis TaxID=2213017 RepID=UPI0013007890|nr:hypothetical protein [Pseudomonas huaxiensis]
MNRLHWIIKGGLESKAARPMVSQLLEPENPDHLTQPEHQNQSTDKAEAQCRTGGEVEITQKQHVQNPEKRNEERTAPARDRRRRTP